jgi:hypothetical protein
MNGAFFLCARQELLLAVRSRWTQVFATVFAALSIAVAVSGYVLSGGHGVQDFSRTTASLVQLVLLLVPLAALLMGVLTLLPDRGAAELLFSQPVSRRTILLGRVTGLWIALVAAQLIGFGAAGLVIFSNAGDAGFSGFALLVTGSAVLTAVFLGLAALVSVGSAGRRRSLSSSGSSPPFSSTSRRSAWRRSSLQAQPRASSSSRFSRTRPGRCGPAPSSPSRGRRPSARAPWLSFASPTAPSARRS